MKINAWKRKGCSKLKEEFNFVSSFQEWEEASVFPEYVSESFTKKVDYEETVPSNLCTATEDNFMSHIQFQQPPPDGNLNSGAWMTKWRNRTVVKFSRGRGKQREGYVGSDMGGVRKVDLSKCGRKPKCAHGIQSLLMALEYVEMQERLQQKPFENSTERALSQRNQVGTNQSIITDSSGNGV